MTRAAFDLAALGAGLPALDLVEPLTAALEEGRMAIVEAPPGSGKTTLVPPLVANLPGTGRVIVTQPRRVAARAAARRLASLSGTRLGDAVGYSVRGDRRVSAGTRVEFVTSGLLLRRLLADPDLTGVDAIVLDEVHERDLDSDLAVAFANDIAGLRDDLRLVAMSATLDAERWSALLGSAPVVHAEVPLHPLEIEWRPAPAPRIDERGVTREFLGHVAATTREALLRHPDGSALVFLPGAREVDAVVRDLVGSGIEAVPLTGSLSAAAQDAALAPSPGRRRAIVATSIAESALTVPDVRLVIDSCLAREPRLDRERGMSGLVTVAAARASTEQRAGRAARLGPGVTIRCVSEADWAAAPAQARPEIQTSELTGTALMLAAWGAPDGRDLALPDAPPPDHLADAHATLRALDALDADGELTDHGRALLAIPTHPRTARALLDGAKRLGATAAAECVATLESDERSPGADLAATLRALRRGSPASARWRQEVARLTRLIDDTDPSRGLTPSAHATEHDLAVITALAHPERLARARGASGSYQLAGGTGAALPPGSPLVGQPWLAVAEVARAHVRDGSGAVIRAAVPIEEALAIDLAASLVASRTETSWSGGRVVARRIDALGAIELRSTPVRPTAAQARERVVTELREQGLDALTWSEAAAGLRRRLAFLHRHLGAPWPEVSDAALIDRVDEWLGPEIEQLAAGVPSDRVDLHAALERLLPWPDAARFGALAPVRLEVPSGSAVRLDYPPVDEDAPPVLAVKLQECFGWAQTPRVAGGRVPVLLHLLSPARRPLAVTADLESFWSGPYRQVRAEMRGRYPKHPWPEDPWSAPPRKGTTKSGR